MICEHCGRANGHASDGWRPVDAESPATHRRVRCRGCGHEQWMR